MGTAIRSLVLPFTILRPLRGSLDTIKPSCQILICRRAQSVSLLVQANNPSQDRQFTVLKGQDCAPFECTVPDPQTRKPLRDMGLCNWRATVGLEPTTHSLGNCRSIRLSYGRAARCIITHRGARRKGRRTENRFHVNCRNGCCCTGRSKTHSRRALAERHRTRASRC